MGRRVLVLDLDGVLNSRVFMWRNRATWNNSVPESMLDPAACARLERILVETGAVIVVSSSWRVDTSCEEIETALRARGAPSAKVIGATPRSWSGSKRGDEIQRWLDENGPVETFAIVDDNSDMAHLGGRFTQTSWDTGLLDKHARRIIAMLNGGTHDAERRR